MTSNTKFFIPFLMLLLIPLSLHATQANPKHVSDTLIADQRALLEKNTKGAGFGPQSPRDIDAHEGKNQRLFSAAPVCNIHFHKNAEHKGGEFVQYAGNGDGKGFQTGFKYAGNLSKSERKPLAQGACPGKHGELNSGDTIELHYVHSTAQVKPGPTLGAKPLNKQPPITCRNSSICSC